LNRIVRGQFSLGQTLQVIALGQKHTSPPMGQGPGSGRQLSARIIG
jgi:hypothetical protein